MTATNHALAGALIGLTVGNPAVAIPAAFLSHVVIDMIPHFGAQPGKDILTRWFRTLLCVDASLCVVLVGMLTVRHPVHWVLAAVCAFLATSFDLIWIKKFVLGLTTGHARPNRTWLERFHGIEGIQWFQRPIGVVVELAWLVAMLVLLSPFLR